MSEAVKPTSALVGVPEPLWMMHVIGPDDIYPAPDHATAVAWCAYLNREIAPKTPEVLCVGVPAVWTGTAEDHAAELDEAIKGWTVPAAPAAPQAAGVGETHPCYDEHQPGCDCVIPAQTVSPVPSYLERLSAPSREPEGGAVSRDQVLAIVRQFASPSWCSVDRLVDTLFTALATREEAPAEAGEVLDVAFEAWLNERNLLPRGAWDWSSIVAMLSHHEDALRAQPQAREDAQPVGGGYDPSDVRYGLHLIANEECDEVAASYYAKKALGHIYTHPAPDALRVAVEALSEVSALRSNCPGDKWERGFTAGTTRAADIADQALAALQAEQGAK